ncbi:DUF1573 domain-containing protein [Chitinophagaceae bacterium MMS25-I14]
MNRQTKIFIITMLFTGTVYAQQAHGPQLFFPKGTTINVGTVAAGSRKDVFWTFVNKGDKPLIIQDVKTSSSSLLTLSVPREPIQPGQKGQIGFSYYAAGAGEDHPFAKDAVVTWNSTIEDRSYTRLTIKGTELAAPSGDGSIMFFPGGRTVDAGDMPEGPVKEVNYVFINNGSQPMVIRDVTTGCGCLVGEWSKEAVMPGKSGIIKLRYNTAGRPGRFIKNAYVNYNDTNRIELTITGNVIPAPRREMPENSIMIKTN